MITNISLKLIMFPRGDWYFFLVTSHSQNISHFWAIWVLYFSSYTYISMIKVVYGHNLLMGIKTYFLIEWWWSRIIYSRLNVNVDHHVIHTPTSLVNRVFLQSISLLISIYNLGIWNKLCLNGKSIVRLDLSRPHYTMPSPISLP